MARGNATTMGERMRTDLIHPDCTDPEAEFKGWLHELVRQGEDDGDLSVDEMHEIMVEVYEDVV